jgi:chaperonin cofactor prefoldin
LEKGTITMSDSESTTEELKEQLRQEKIRNHDLQEKLERATLRLKSIEKQEDKMKERIKVLQDEVMASMAKKE